MRRINTCSTMYLLPDVKIRASNHSFHRSTANTG